MAGPTGHRTTCASRCVDLSEHDDGCLLVFIHVVEDRTVAAQTAASWDAHLARLKPHAGGHLSEEEAHEPWEEGHQCDAEHVNIDPEPGRRFLAQTRASS